MTDIHDEPLLLTPGPCSISMATKQAMLHDYSSGEEVMVEKMLAIRDYLLKIVNGVGSYAMVPLVGSGTYATEAAIGTFVPRDGKLLVHTNGVYGDRIVDLCQHLRINFTSFRTQPFTPPTRKQFEDALKADPAITHVMVVHCETSTGILNPMEDIAQVCRAYGKGLLIDAVASFGIMDIDARKLGFDALCFSANKGMQAPPGLAFVIAKKSTLEETKGNCHSLSLDLWDQYQHFERTSSFRFTPATHLLLAFAQACKEHEEEGGTVGRRARYSASWRRLIEGMRQMGFQTLLDDSVASPIVSTFHDPDDPNYSFNTLYAGMKKRGFIIFPGRLAAANTFRIANIGIITPDDIGRAMDALAECFAEMGVKNFGRAEVAAA